MSQEDPTRQKDARRESLRRRGFRPLTLCEAVLAFQMVTSAGALPEVPSAESQEEGRDDEGGAGADV
ncbi:MAG: hypothetical protein AB2A00_19910 [Myxococcota bacterium]